MTQINPLNDPNFQKQPPVPNQPVEPAAPGSSPPATPHKRKWLRRTLYIVGGLVVVLLILILLIPTIAGMGFVRSIVVGKINENLNGRVQIASWSLGWTGGVKADGIKVFDDQNRQILEIPHVSTQLSLVNAIKGKYALGETVIQGLDFNAVRYPDGSLNFEHLAKAKPAGDAKPIEQKTPQAPAAKNGPDARSAPTKLPEVSGHLRLEQGRGTVENITKDPQSGQEKHDMVKFTSLVGDVKIPDINQPITDSLDIVEDNGMPQPGKISAAGQLTIAKNNLLLETDQMDIGQTLALTDVELKGFAWAMPGTILAGNTSGNLVVTLKPGEGASVAGSILSKGFRFGGPALDGDTYAADSLTITIPKTIAKLIAAANDQGGAIPVDHIRIGEGSGQAITIALVNSAGGKPSQSTIKLTADASAASLEKLAANQTPGANGNLRADVDLDLVPLTEMLPHVLKWPEGSRLDTGRLADTFEIVLAPNQALVTQTLAVSQITGEQVNHKKIEVDPINLALKAIDRGGAGKIPDLHDISLNLTTAADPKGGWASANITAPTLTALKGEIHADLQRAQAQIGQLREMGDLKLGGTLDVTLQSEGDLVGDIKAGQTAKNAISVKTLVRDLLVDGIQDKPPIKEPLVSADITANLERGSDGMVQFVRDLKAKILAGTEAKPSITVTAGGNLDLSQKSASQETILYNVVADLPQVQNEFGGFMTALSDSNLQFTTGAITVIGDLKYDGKTAVVKPQVKLDNVSLDRDKGAVHVLKNYVLTIDAPLNYSSANSATNIQIDKLTLADNTGMLRLESAGPLKIVTTADGRMQPTVNLHITSIDLKQLNDLMQAMSTEAAVVTPEGTPLKSGILSGTANVTSAENHQIALAGDLNINGLTINSPQSEGLQNEQVKLALDLRAADDFSSARVNKLDAVGSFVNAHVSDTEVTLKQGTGKDAKPLGTLDMVRKFTAKIDFPSLAKLQTVMDAFSPPAATQPVAITPSRTPPAARGNRVATAQPAPTTEPMPQPTKLASGTATLILNGTRQGDRLSILPNLTVRNLVLRKPDREVPIGSVDVTATEVALLMRPATQTQASSRAATRPTTEPSIMDQVKELKIGQLVARLSGAEFAVNGSIVDLGKTRSFQGLGADLAYDAPKLWQLIVPLVFDKEGQAKWKDAKVAGSYKKHINIAGSFPTTLPAGQQPITMVTASGDIALDHFEAQGMTLDKLVLPFNIERGIASLTYAGKPAGQNIAAPASLNGGTLDLGGVSMDLSGPHTLLNIPPGKKLFDNVSLNPAAAQLVGDWVNNPMFVTANEAAGQMFFTINKCQNLPMDDTVNLTTASNTGLFDADIKVNKIHLGNEVFQKVSDAIASAKVLGGQTLNVKSLQGDISKWHVTIDHGITRQDMTMTFGEGSRPLHLTGDVAMQTRQMNMLLDMPWEFFGLKNNKSVASLTSGGLEIPLSGPVTNPQFDVGKAVQKNLVENGPQNILQGILGQNKDKNAAPTSQPDKQNPLGALEDLLNQNKNKDKKK